LGENLSCEILCHKVKTREIDFNLVDLVSYKQFKERLEAVMETATQA